MDDNLSLSERVKERYRKMYSGIFFKRYILGLWVVAEGVIYSMFDTGKHLKEIVDDLKGEYYVSIDYGTQNATVFLLWLKTKEASYCIKEYYYSGRDKGVQKTDSEFADDLEEFTQGYKIRRIVVDPSAASFIAELKKRKFNIKKAKNDVLDGIRFTASLLSECKIFFSEKCTNTIKEFNSYVWDEKAANRGEDKPIKDNDHAMDAVRYYCYTILKSSGISVLK